MSGLTLLMIPQIIHSFKLRKIRKLITSTIFAFLFLLVFSGTVFASPNWINQGNTDIARSLHKAVLLDGGKVLIAGGSPPNTSARTKVEIFTPSINGIGTWSVVANMNHDRIFHTLSLVSSQQNGPNKVLAVGGYLNTAELYDQNTNTWTKTPDMNQSRSGHSVSNN